nr:uncharacterized protein LOC129440460 [Misgurnus anguillicaudatus]
MTNRHILESEDYEQSNRRWNDLEIHEFFSQPGGIDQIDAVCFVVQASLARLTHTQKYIFDSILSIFGKDIADNILMLITFADGNKRLGYSPFEWPSGEGAIQTLGAMKKSEAAVSLGRENNSRKTVLVCAVSIVAEKLSTQKTFQGSPAEAQSSFSVNAAVLRRPELGRSGARASVVTVTRMAHRAEHSTVPPLVHLNKRGTAEGSSNTDRTAMRRMNGINRCTRGFARDLATECERSEGTLEPSVLEAIKVSQVPCSTDESEKPLHFKFNNSALLINNNKTVDDESDFGNFEQMFWKLGIFSLKKFLKSLNQMKTKSLILTQEVLKERQQLEVLVEGLQPQINAGLTKLDEIKKINAALKQHKAEMDSNKDFEYEFEVTVPKQIKTKPGTYLTNCQICHFTCHDNCIYADDKDKHQCSAMQDGKCRVCPGKCVWNVHFNQAYKWEYVKEMRKDTYNELKQRFEVANDEVMSKEKIFEKLEQELEDVQIIVFELIDSSQKSLERLQEIALKPNPLSTPDYIDLMIEAEKQEAKPAFQDRIQSLMNVRKQAEIMSKVSTGEVLPEDWRRHTQEKEKRSDKSYNPMILFGRFKNFFIGEIVS